MLLLLRGAVRPNAVAGFDWVGERPLRASRVTLAARLSLLGAPPPPACSREDAAACPCLDL